MIREFVVGDLIHALCIEARRIPIGHVEVSGEVFDLLMSRTDSAGRPLSSFANAGAEPLFMGCRLTLTTTANWRIVDSAGETIREDLT